MDTAPATCNKTKPLDPDVYAHANDLGSGATAAVHSVLFVDDQVDAALVRLLEADGFRIKVARSGHEALGLALRDSYEAIVLDLHLPDMFGLTVLGRLRAKRISASVIVVTGYYGEDEVERLALRSGALAFKRKPFDYEDVRTILKDIAPNVPEMLRRQPPEDPDDEQNTPIVCGRASERLARWIARVGPSSVPALITGESGVGKELAARALHATSPRRNGPFVPVNCGAIPDGLLESELFGHAKGAYTGAVTDKAGLLEAAHNGTIFLDEIAELPPSMQVRFLRAVEDGDLRRIGETRVRHVDVRIVAATNRPIGDEVRSGRFRSDLYFRLAVATYHIPPLRERRDEIEPLARHWLKRTMRRENSAVMDISSSAASLLRGYHWPGNIRELRNVIEHSVLWATGCELTKEDISGAISALMCSTSQPPRHVVERSFEESMKALEEHHWNRTAAARSLGIDRTTLWRRLKRFGISEDHRNS